MSEASAKKKPKRKRSRSNDEEPLGFVGGVIKRRRIDRSSASSVEVDLTSDKYDSPKAEVKLDSVIVDLEQAPKTLFTTPNKNESAFSGI